MTRPSPQASALSTATSVAAIALAAALLARIVVVLQSGAVEPLVAMRTYVFWAVVCVPVALLADLLLRTIWEYEISQLARQRINARRRR
jgi:uncharacterized membrane protein YjfL (UPF0719 family)